MTARIFYLTVLFTFVFRPAWADDREIAAIKWFSGNVCISEPDRIPARDLMLIAGTVIKIGPGGELCLFFRDGKKIIFPEGKTFRIREAPSKLDLYVEPLNKDTSLFLRHRKKSYAYHDEEIAGSMGQETGEDAISQHVKDQIERIDNTVKDEMMRYLIKGLCYRENGNLKAANRQFRKHYRLHCKEKKN